MEITQKLYFCLVILTVLVNTNCSLQKSTIRNLDVSKNQRVVLSKNSILRLNLKSDYGNGSKWHLSDSIVLKSIVLDSIAYSRKHSEEMAAGSAGNTEVFHFNTKDVGTDTLVFLQYQPWNRNEVLSRVQVILDIE